MARALAQLIVTSLVSVLLAQPNLKADGAQASQLPPKTSLSGAEEQSELYANTTLAKLVSYTNSLRADANGTSWISRQAQLLQANADAKISATECSVGDARIAKKHALVGLSVKEVDMSLNSTQFSALRVQRADLLAELDVDHSKLAALTPAYRTQLIRTDLCTLQKTGEAKVDELANSAQSALAQLAIIVGVASKTGNSDQAIAARSVELRRCLAGEVAAAKKLVQSLPGLVVARIDGMSGGCVDDEETHEKKDKKDKKEKKADKHKEGKKDKHKKKKENKHGKGGKGGKGGKHGKHQAAMYFLVGTSEPEELENEGVAEDTLGIGKQNIGNLKALYEQAAAAAKQSLSLIGRNLQSIAAKEFGSQAVESIGDKIMSSFTKELEQKRQATITNLEDSLKTLASLANDPGSEKYAALLASTNADIATMKQLSVQVADSQGPLSAVSKSEEAELELFDHIVDSVSSSAEAMVDYADAITQLQDKMGQNATGPFSTLSKRMNEAAEDAQGVANLVMKDFYDDVEQYVQKHMAKSQASSSAVVEKARLFLASLPEAHAAWTVQITGVAAMGALMGGLAVLMLARQRQQSSAVNQAPLLG